MFVRGILIAVLSVVACARQMTAVGQSGYTPKWHVGDWWIVKTWEMRPRDGDWWWRYRRYDVAGIEKVGKNDCYVIEIRGDLQPKIEGVGDPGIVLYVRTDNWRLVRTVQARDSSGMRVSPRVFNTPDGRFGPFVSEPRLPRFPLRLMSRDTAFKTERRRVSCADLREISRPADPALVERLLAEGDTADTRVVRPSGAVYQVRNEIAGNHIPGPQPGAREFTQSLQLWSDDLPWRSFEELVSYRGPTLTRCVNERSWLIAVGHNKR